MAKKIFGENSLTYFITLIRSDLDKKLDKSSVITDLDSTDSTKALAASAASKLLKKTDIPMDPEGKVDSAKESDHATSADTATNATNAEHAETATNATNATNAEKADSATTAENATKLGGIDASQYVKFGVDGKVPSDKLPSYVDDVIEGYFHEGHFYTEATHENLIDEELGKIYVDITTDNEPVSYRFSGSAFIAIVSSDLVEISNAEIDALWNPS